METWGDLGLQISRICVEAEGDEEEEEEDADLRSPGAPDFAYMCRDGRGRGGGGGRGGGRGGERRPAAVAAPVVGAAAGVHVERRGGGRTVRRRRGCGLGGRIHVAPRRPLLLVVAVAPAAALGGRALLGARPPEAGQAQALGLHRCRRLFVAVPAGVDVAPLVRVELGAQKRGWGEK